jgi:diaminohydroxyphosphoribosylaminopyrimidine deaminase / 5-amino-6-(5-phosphoribosylamino)uracil reductase
MPTDFSPQDHRFMHAALTLARKGQGDVEPNPMVGAVLVKNGKTIARGYHRYFGGPHAEVDALRRAGDAARGATLYVTLEPCCHHGKQPPCTDAIVDAGIKRVVVAMVDPFAKVHGKGIRLLRKHGIRVDVGLLEDDARALNAPFITRLTKSRPYVIAKWAQTLDGAIATATGESQWISSEYSRLDVQKLRGRMDAILVGIGTALSDNPLLMARPDSARDLHRLATRIVLDSHCRLPPKCRLIDTMAFAPLVLVHAAKFAPDAEKRRKALAARGVQMWPLPTDSSGRPKLHTLLKTLGELEYANIMVEGGPEVLASFFRARLIDEAQIYIAPTIIGGKNARHAVGGPDLKQLSHALRGRYISGETIGPDAKLTIRFDDTR